MTATAKQLAVLVFIREFQEVRGKWPTHAEIGKHFGRSLSTVAQHLAALESKGLIVRHPGESRNMEIPDA